MSGRIERWTPNVLYSNRTDLAFGRRSVVQFVEKTIFFFRLTDARTTRYDINIVISRTHQFP